MRFILKSLFSRLNSDQFALRISILFFISIQSVLVNAQDTLIYNSGKTEVVKIISLSNEQKLLKYVLNKDTVVRTFSSISEFKIYSKDVDSIILNPGKSSPTNLMDQDFRRVKRRNNSFTQPSTYTYSGFSFGLNTLSFLSSSRLLEYQIASNTHISLYVEYKYKERFSMRLAGRIGLSKANLNESWDPSYGPRKNHNNNHLLFELGIEPTFYLNRHNKTSIYLKTGFYLGKNYGLESIHFKDYYNYPNPAFDSTIYISHSKNSIGDLKFYYRTSLSTGIEINPLKHLSFGLEVGVYIGNNFHGQWTTYYNTHQSEEYIWLEEGYNSSRYSTPIKFQGAVNLIYRIGGKVRSHTDKS